MTLRLSIFALVFLLIVGSEEVKPESQNSGFDLVDKAGNIRKPGEFRDRYQALGTYMVLDPKGDQMHATYELSEDGKVCGWHRSCEGSVWNRPRSNDDRRRALGRRHKGLVRDGQGRKGPLFRQSTVG
jgi:hypothetical protein